MNDQKLKNIASKVLSKANISEDQKFGSVIAILMIISIILTLVRVLQECNKNKLTDNCSSKDKYSLYGSEMKNYSIKRGWFTKMRIKKVLRKELSKEDYTKYSFQLLNAILDSGSNITDDEVITLVENANV
ncbi:MAG: hypothetical protein ACK55I_24065 [bacterium]|jgi:hypothetical protein